MTIFRDNYPNNIEAPQKLYIEYSHDITFDYSTGKYPDGTESEWHWENSYIPIAHKINGLNVGRHEWMRIKIGEVNFWSYPIRMSANITNIQTIESEINESTGEFDFSIKLIFEDGSSKQSDPITIKNGLDGVEIVSAQINEDGYLIITYSDGVVENAGMSRGHDAEGLPPSLNDDYILSQSGGIPVWVSPEQVLANVVTGILPIEYDFLTGQISHNNDDGNRHIPVGGSNGYILSTNGSGTYTWLDPTELDPTVPSWVKDISELDILNWDTAYGWGDHSGLYLPISTQLAQTKIVIAGQLFNSYDATTGLFTTTAETDPIFLVSPAASITLTDITNLSNLSGINTGDQNLSGYLFNYVSIYVDLNAYVPTTAEFIRSTANSPLGSTTVHGLFIPHSVSPNTYGTLLMARYDDDIILNSETHLFIRHLEDGVWQDIEEIIHTGNIGSYAGGMNINGTNSDIEYLYFQTDIANPAHTEGRLFYDQTVKALSYYNEASDVTVNLGRESLIRVYNNTGSTILNGVIVAPNATYLGVPTIVLADAKQRDYSRLVGVVTMDIPNNSFGYVTKFGSVSNINTTGFTVGDLLYLSDTVPGEITTSTPTDGSYSVVIGAVAEVGISGKIIVDIIVSSCTVEVNDTNGFSPGQRNNTALAFDNITSTFTISATSYPYYYYQDGFKYEVGSAESVILPTTEGLYIIYYDLGVLNYILNATAAQSSEIIRTKCIVAYVYWDATNSEIIYFGDERHGISMSPVTHSYLHFTRGAQYLSGFAIGDILVNQSGNLDVHAQFSVAEGNFLDEDLIHIGTAKAVGDNWRIYYIFGASNLRVYEKTGFAVMTDIDAGIGTTGRLVYNQFIGGNYQLTVIPDDDCVLCHVFAVNCYDNTKKIVTLMGQVAYTTATLARAGASTEISNLISILPFQEMIPIGTIIFQTDTSELNAVKAHIISTSTGENYVDWRTTELSQGTPATSHANLSDLYYATTGVAYGHISDQAQSIDGIKTFLAFPITPSSAPTSDYQVANKYYVDKYKGVDATVGSGGDYASIELAIAANKYRLRVISSITTTSQISPTEPTIIYLDKNVVITLFAVVDGVTSIQNCTFIGEGWVVSGASSNGLPSISLSKTSSGISVNAGIRYCRFENVEVTSPDSTNSSSILSECSLYNCKLSFPNKANNYFLGNNNSLYDCWLYGKGSSCYGVANNTNNTNVYNPYISGIFSAVSSTISGNIAIYGGYVNAAYFTIQSGFIDSLGGNWQLRGGASVYNCTINWFWSGVPISNGRYVNCNIANLTNFIYGGTITTQTFIACNFTGAIILNTIAHILHFNNCIFSSTFTMNIGKFTMVGGSIAGNVIINTDYCSLNMVNIDGSLTLSSGAEYNKVINNTIVGGIFDNSGSSNNIIQSNL